jgi:GNAT superfamily N-acetyltransferase
LTSVDFAEELRSSMRRAGPRAAYARVMGRLARHAGLRVFRIFERPLGAGTQAPAAGLDSGLLSERDAAALCADASLDLTPSKIQAAYARGDLCVGAFLGAELAGYCWLGFSAAPHMDRAWLDFPSDVVYTYKSYVRPAFRGRGIAAAMYRFADPVAVERGRKVAIICVESHNWRSIAAAKRGGFSAAGYAAYVGGARLRVWCSPRAARYGLRFFLPSV